MHDELRRELAWYDLARGHEVDYGPGDALCTCCAWAFYGSPDECAQAGERHRVETIGTPHSGLDSQQRYEARRAA